MPLMLRAGRLPAERRIEAGRYRGQAHVVRAWLRWIVSASLIDLHVSPLLLSSLRAIPTRQVALTRSGGPDPHVEGAKGGQSGGHSGGESYKPSEHGGMKKDGTEDKRTSSEHGFGGS